jgi:hypothetical protein
MKITAVIPHVVVQRLEQPFGMSQWLWDVRSSCLVEVVTERDSSDGASASIRRRPIAR